MLDIQIYQKEKKKQLELTPGTILEMERKSPLFDTNKTDGSYSLPVEIPQTPTNSALLGAPEMVESHNQGLPYWQADILDNGIPVINRGKLTLLKTKGKLDHTSGQYSMNITGSESLFGSIIKGKTLRQLELGGTIDLTNNYDSREFANMHMHGYIHIAQKYDYIGFAPIYWPEFLGGTDLLVAQDIVNNMVFDSQYWNGWWFGRPHPNFLNQSVNKGQQFYNDYRTVPFFKIVFILNSIFSEHGYKLTGDFINDSDYADLYLFNNRAIEFYSFSSFTDNNRVIFPRQHVPDMTIAEFITALEKTFNFDIFYSDDRAVIRYKNSVLNNTNPIDITPWLLNSIESDPTEESTEGYKVKWTSDSNDQLYNERFKNIDESKLRATEQDTSRILSTNSTTRKLGLNPPPQYGDLVYVINENAYYEYRSDFWKYYCEGHDVISYGNGGIEKELPITPLVQFTEEYIVSSQQTVKDICGYKGEGSYIDNGGYSHDNDCGLRMMYIKKFNIGNATGVPVAFTHSLAPGTGIRRTLKSLSLISPDGIYQNHHRQWLETKAKSRLHRYELQANCHHVNDYLFESPVRAGNIKGIVESMRQQIGGHKHEITILKV